MTKVKITAITGADDDYGLYYNTDVNGLAKSIKSVNFRGNPFYLVEMKTGEFTLVNPDHIIEVWIEKINP
jgi:hypothetical protein